MGKQIGKQMRLVLKEKILLNGFNRLRSTASNLNATVSNIFSSENLSFRAGFCNRI